MRLFSLSLSLSSSLSLSLPIYLFPNPFTLYLILILTISYFVFYSLPYKQVLESPFLTNRSDEVQLFFPDAFPRRFSRLSGRLPDNLFLHITPFLYSASALSSIFLLFLFSSLNQSLFLFFSINVFPFFFHSNHIPPHNTTPHRTTPLNLYPRGINWMSCTTLTWVICLTSRKRE